MIDLIEAATFDTPITVPEGTDTHDLAAENVEDIAQKLANRTAYLKARADDAAQRGADNTFTANNTFNLTVHFGVDVLAAHDVVASHDVNASNNQGAGNDMIAGRDMHAFRDVIATRDFIYPTPKPTTSLISLNTGVVFGPAQALFHDVFFTLAACTSWISDQFVAWRILLPTGAVIQNMQVIHNQSTVDPNQFNIVRRHGAVYDFLGGGTTIPTITPLIAAPVNGPTVAGLWTTVMVPSAPITVDNSVNEYWITWKSTGLHIADSIAEINVGWNDKGPHNG